MLALYRKYYSFVLLLSVLAIFFTLIKINNQVKMSQPLPKLSQISPIIDSIQVNGDLLSFQGKNKAQKYQVYYTLKSPKEQRFYKNLIQNCDIYFTGNVEFPEQKRNFNGFDAQKYFASQNIYAQITIKDVKRVELKSNFDVHLLRRKAIVWAQNHFPQPMSDYLTGLLFGFLSKDFSQMSDIYSSLGIIHLFALSGMQVNFFIDFFRKLLLRLGMTQESTRILQVPFSIFYACMTGFSISVLRALFQKNIRLSGLDNIAATTLILMLISPKFLLTTAGQLTLLYAFVLSLLTSHFEQFAGFRKLLIESVALSVVVLPLLIFDFHIFQPFSIVLTLIFGVIFDSFLLPLLLGVFSLSLLGLTINLNPLFRLLEKVVLHLDSFLHYPFVLGQPNPLELVMMLALGGLLIDYFSKKKRRWSLIFSLILLFFFSKNPIHPSITAIDVGQGDSILLQDTFNQENILIDTGGRLAIPEKSWQQAQTQTNAEKTLIPYLQSVGVSHIDQLILTHTDADHVGDFLNLADKIKIKEVWVSPGELTDSSFVAQLKAAHIALHLTKVGDKIPIFKSNLQVLSNGYTQKGDNNDSIVTYGKFFNKSFLFTGDLEQNGEMKLLKTYPNLKVDVLKAGHHGSKTSSNPKFIKAIEPKLALISVGKNNRYGHPNQSTLKTFKKYKVKILRTDQKGAIKLTQINHQWQITTAK